MLHVHTLLHWCVLVAHRSFPMLRSPNRSHAFTRVAPEIERLFESVARR